MFNPGMSGISLADIAAVSRNNDGWGDGNNAWWILLFALWGWGGNGNWGNGGNGTQAEVQRGFDTQAIISKLDGLNSGLCSLGYDQLAQLNGVNQNVTTTGYNIERAVQADTIANMQNQFALSNQIGDCCCTTKQLIGELKFDMATSDSSIKTLISQVAQQLGWSQQTGFRDLADLINERFNQLSLQQKDAIIADLTAKLNNCDRDNSLQAIATYIINTLNPRSVPAYPGCNPNNYGNWNPNMLSGSCSWNGNCCTAA